MLWPFPPGRPRRALGPFPRGRFRLIREIKKPLRVDRYRAVITAEYWLCRRRANGLALVSRPVVAGARRPTFAVGVSNCKIVHEVKTRRIKPDGSGFYAWRTSTRDVPITLSVDDNRRRWFALRLGPGSPGWTSKKDYMHKAPIPWPAGLNLQAAHVRVAFDE